MGIGIRCNENLKQFDGQIGFYYPKETVMRAQLEDFWENAPEDTKKEIEGLVLFRTETGVEIENRRLNRSEEGDLIETAGNMNLVIPGKLMKGSFVTDSDCKGCVISRKTAENLFRNHDIIGEEISIGKKDYAVRGIVNLEKSLCMIQGDYEKSYSYIRAYAPKLPMSVVQQMLTGLIPENNPWISEGNLYYGAGSILLWLPAWTVLFNGLFRYKKAVSGIENKGLKYVLKILARVGGFAGGCMLLTLSFKFSDDYVPTVWSDFEFWSELIQQKKEMIFMLLEYPMQTADVIMLQNLAGVLAASVGLFILTFNSTFRTWKN